MCGMCGLWGETAHWSAAGAAPPGVAMPVGQEARARARRLQQQSLDRVCRAFGASVADWNGTSWVVTSAHGASELAGSLPELWRAVGTLSTRPIDPFDAVLLDALEARAATGHRSGVS